MIKFCNRVIEYSFYAIFLLVPLAFTSATSELFEMNKMWLTWGLTVIIGTFWFIKMVLRKKILLCRTPLDIPIGLFLLSQIISTIFSLDSHVSFWGYYSRFNGGLLSMLTYAFLYYAFLSNFTLDTAKRLVKRFLYFSLASGAIVALWGLPSHFGYDPTCLLFRGTFDVSCWTQDFMPKIRIFSTMGQPDWLAAYLAILIPISIAFLLNHLKPEESDTQGKNHESRSMQYVPSKIEGNYELFSKRNILNSLFIILASLFYLDLLYTRARSGFLGIWIALAFFVFFYLRANKQGKNILKNIKSPLGLVIAGLLSITFFIGQPFPRFDGFTFEGLKNTLHKSQVVRTLSKALPIPTPVPEQSFSSGGGGTESSRIRMFVWEGAFNAWKDHPIFGTGVETFAYAYYKYKPAGQNTTTEWNFLYNKAHNEYLNYLATTGIWGFGTYLFMIGWFLFISFKGINSKSEAPNPKQIQNSSNKNSKSFGFSSFGNSNLFGNSNFEFRILALGLLASYISILVTDFFGFSVVITNIYLFMIPAFVFVLSGTVMNSENEDEEEYEITPAVMTVFFVISTISVFFLYLLIRFWIADTAYALGSNYNKAGEYQMAYSELHKAAELRNEPVFRDEISINAAILATSLLSQKIEDQAQEERALQAASTLASEAISTSNDVISKHPNNTVFWKTRTRVFYTLSQVDPKYLPRALDSIMNAFLLAPNDANISYNLGVIYGQNNKIQEGIKILEKTVELKPDYRDARYALGLFYHTASLDKDEKTVVDKELNQKAIEQMEYILKYIWPEDPDASASARNWKQL